MPIRRLINLLLRHYQTCVQILSPLHFQKKVRNQFGFSNKTHTFAVEIRKKNVELEQRAAEAEERAKTNEATAAAYAGEVKEAKKDFLDLKGKAEDLQRRVDELEAYKALPWYKKLFRKENV